MKINNTKRHGSIFLLALTVMTVVFILAFSVAFFTGSEDYASAMSYEREVAFNLAESAVEEFVARLKNALNHSDGNNQLYYVLRNANTDVSKEIPLKAEQVSKLTAYTRETARQLYGIQFGRGLVKSKDFVVDAVIKLKHINPVEAKMGNKVLYRIKQDLKEKQGELKVNATVTYKGHVAKVSLTFLIRVVKTFIPPFNYFTLYVKDGSVFGGSHFNTFVSSVNQKRTLRLDNGWNSIKQNFNATQDFASWESALSLVGNKAQTPPGRVYLGQDMYTLSKSPAVIIRSTNGAKLLYGNNLNSNVQKFTQMNAQENFYLRFDVPWIGLKDYAKNFMELQGQMRTKGKKFIFFGGWNNKTQIRLFNIGSGKELIEPTTAGAPSFINCLQTYAVHTGKIVSQAEGGINSDEGRMRARLMPELDKSGLDIFGTAPPRAPLAPTGGADFTKLSPTLVYGPAMRQYFRGVEIWPDGGEPFEMPFIATNGPLIKMMPGIKGKTVLTATQARDLFLLAGLPKEHAQKIYKYWDKMPKQLRKLKNYGNFMSDSGVELYNKGLTNFIQRLKGQKAEYTGPLKPFVSGYLGNYPYPYSKIPKGMETVINNSPMREFYEGALWDALPKSGSSYLMDFYFIPRSTEDFFRGRMTVAEGGISWDRFQFKYINKVKAYLNKVNNQTLELNGILALNDSEPLGLRNLKFKGNGIIYSSPMMGGGKVVISGDFVGATTPLDGAFASCIGDGNGHYNMMTIVAPQIVIDTSKAQGSRCFVEANLMSVTEPLMVIGDKPITIKGTVVTPFLNLEDHFHPKQKGNDTFQCEDVIIYNPLNGIWRNKMPKIMDKLYVAKIVTGGVGKFDWAYERNQ